MKHPRRRGLTLIELLVVVAIIGLLAGLLLPAVQAARESARRTICGNNIRQIGLACLSYHTSMNSLPPLYEAQGSNGGYPWTLLILPFMEQGATADLLRTTHPFSYTGATQAAAEAPIPTFICPSCQVGLTATADADRTAIGWVPGFRSSKCNYLGNGGPQAMYAGEPPAPSGFAAGPAMVTMSRGAIRKIRGLPLSAVSDGASNTFLVGESGGRTSQQVNLAGYWATGYRDDNAATSMTRYGFQKINAGTTAAFNSNHPGGATFVMCDGAVRFVSEDISFNAGNLIWPMTYWAAASDPTYPDKAVAVMRSAGYGVFQYLSCRDDRNAISGADF